MVLRLYFLFLIVLSSYDLPAQELQKIGHLPYAPASLAGCWHYVDSLGGEWALVGTSKGLSIVDVSDPTLPQERFFVPGITNNWREVRTWNGFAYVGSEALWSGIHIVDLRALPDTIYSKKWHGDPANDSLIVKSHALQTADGFLYVFGGIGTLDGAVIADLADPWNPVVVGKYTQNYVHDGFVRGDTLYTSEIFAGWFAVLDISDKSDPKLLAVQSTPAYFNHNTELNPSGTVIFTTDERANAPLTSYDITNLEDIKQLDVYYPSVIPSGEVHNVRVFNNFLVNPSYRGQLTIVDATRPANLIETGWDSLGTSLVWDADPYLPSGIVLATAKSEGLFIYKKPEYRHACWLEGKVTDALTGAPLASAKVFVVNTSNADTSRHTGWYGTGNAAPGAYFVFAEKKGYYPKIFNNVELNTNEVTILDIELEPVLSGASSVFNEAQIEVSPVPFSDFIHISVTSEESKIIRAELFDSNGRLVKQTWSVSGTHLQLDALDDLPSGTFILKLTNDQAETYIRKVLKYGG